MKNPRTLLVVALLFGVTPIVLGQASGDQTAPVAAIPSRVLNVIMLKVQVLRLPEAKLKEANGGKMPPKVFVVPADPKSVENLVKLGAKVIAEPSLATSDGRTASFLSGGEVPVSSPRPGEERQAVDWLTFGTKLEFFPRILDVRKISLRFRFEQTGRAEETAIDKAAQALSGAVMTSGIISEGIATLKEGESVFAIVPIANSADKEGDGDALVMFFTPEITGEILPDATPVKPASLPLPSEVPPYPVVEIQTRPARISKLQSDRRADLLLEVTESGVLESPENIRTVSITSGREGIITVTAESSRRLKVQAKQVGTATLLVTDGNGQEYQALVEVKPPMGTTAVGDTLRRLFPDAQVEVIALNESLLLRGSVTNADHIKQITEIAEQYAPKVLNHLVVDDGLSPQLGLPAGMRYHSVLAFLLDETKAENEGLYVEADVEIEWTELVEGKAIKCFKPLLKGVCMAGSESVPEFKTPEENAIAKVILVVTPDQVGILNLAQRISRLRVRLVKPAASPIPVGTIDRDTEARLREALAESRPSARLPVIPGDARLDNVQESTEIQELRSDVRALRQDVKRLIEILEKKAAGKATPPASSSEPLVPYYGDPVKPQPAGPNPVLPPANGWVDPLDLPKNPAKPRAVEPQATSANDGQDRIETKPLPADLDPSAFVIVRSFNSEDAFSNPGPASSGSGVVIESTPGAAVILTAAHLVKGHETGKYNFQVAAGRQIESDGKTRSIGGPFPATVILQDDKADIVLLRAKVPVKLGVISLARHSLPKMQDTIHCIGFAKDGGRTPQSVNAKVVEVNRYEGPENFEFASLIPNGFSGAAVLDKSFQLIGIASALDSQDNRTLCSPTAEIRKLLATNQTPEPTDPEGPPAPNLAGPVAQWQTHIGRMPTEEPVDPNWAKTVFGPDSWAANAKFTMGIKGAYLYFNEWTPSDADKTVRFKPFAMIPLSKGGTPDALRRAVMCDSATFQFDEPFRFGKPGSFNPKSGTLEGEIRGMSEDSEYAKVLRILANSE